MDGINCFCNCIHCCFCIFNGRRDSHVLVKTPILIIRKVYLPTDLLFYAYMAIFKLLLIGHLVHAFSKSEVHAVNAFSPFVTSWLFLLPSKNHITPSFFSNRGYD